jgi:hypothetical protein
MLQIHGLHGPSGGTNVPRVGGIDEYDSYIIQHGGYLTCLEFGCKSLKTAVAARFLGLDLLHFVAVFQPNKRTVYSR